MEESNESSSSGSKTGVIIGAIVLLVVAAGGYYYWSSQMMSAKTSDQAAVMEDNESEGDGTMGEVTTMDQSMTMEGSPASGSPESAMVMMEDGVQSVAIEGGNFYFKPNEIKVKAGTPVKVTFKNMQGFHDFVIDELDVKTKQITANNSETVEFTATKKGKYEFYCSVGQHRQMGMKGTLIVE